MRICNYLNYVKLPVPVTLASSLCAPPPYPPLSSYCAVPLDADYYITYSLRRWLLYSLFKHVLTLVVVHKVTC